MYVATNKDLIKARREAVSFTKHAEHRRVATMEGVFTLSIVWEEYILPSGESFSLLREWELL